MESHLRWVRYAKFHAEVLKQLGPEDLADLEILLDKSELEKRSEEVKSGDYVTMEELESLRDV